VLVFGSMISKEEESLRRTFFILKSIRTLEFEEWFETLVKVQGSVFIESLLIYLHGNNNERTIYSFFVRRSLRVMWSILSYLCTELFSLFTVVFRMGPFAFPSKDCCETNERDENGKEVGQSCCSKRKDKEVTVIGQYGGVFGPSIQTGHLWRMCQYCTCTVGCDHEGYEINNVQCII
jgi:hypothetical protein